MKLKHLNSSQAFQLKNSKFGNFMGAFSKIFLQQAIPTTIRHTKLALATTYSLEAKIASRVYKNTTWFNGKEGDELQVEIETNKDSTKEVIQLPVSTLA